ncbi:MAG: hypothetical protein F6K18_25515 [Okeania sp. SIO2C2]|uniref:hypothetical protein n=1 Tax=Okeania sp. SIO2C2 TaxID=2607787 RepID=UPI0013B606B7|nr:hypothetical protein [Okeania sp. SIO2C2]NEP89910.1 hypothetical protein [Okeania sp. SIO2C2]
MLRQSYLTSIKNAILVKLNFKKVNIESALELTLAEVCQTMNWDFGEAWIPDPEATMLKFSRGWYSSNSNNGTLPAALKFRQQHQIITFNSQ